MRPGSIVRFEQAYLGSVLVWLVNLGASWKSRAEAIENNPAFAGNPQMLEMAQTMMVGMSVMMLILMLLLWYFTARRASVVAKWVIVVLFGFSTIGLPFTLMGAPVAGMLSTALSVLGYVLSAIAVWFLFRPDAALWFKGGSAAGQAEPFE